MAEKKNKVRSGTSPRRVAGVIVAALVVLVLLAVAGVYFAIRSATANVDRAETIALLGRIGAIHRAVDPIARDYTSANQSAPINVTAYRLRVERARTVVVAVNGTNLTSPEGLKLRDQIATGGATILDGLSLALDALQSDDQTMAVAAGQQVDAGLAMLDEAQQTLTAKAKAHGWIP